MVQHPKRIQVQVLAPAEISRQPVSSPAALSYSSLVEVRGRASYTRVDSTRGHDVDTITF